MNRPRFTIRAILETTAFVALGLFVLKNATETLVAQALHAAVIVTIVAAFPMAMIARGRAAAFLTGYAIAGATYLALCNSRFGHFLPTEALAGDLANRWFLIDNNVYFPEISMWDGRAANFQMTCRALCTFFVAVLSGIGVRLLVKDRRLNPSPDPPDGSLLAPRVSRWRLSSLWSDSTDRKNE